jgi:hypothetical protein
LEPPLRARPRLASTLLCAAACAASIPALGQSSNNDGLQASAACSNIPHADHPRAVLSNGSLEAVLFLPDAANGYYRGSRFDWAGVIPCVSYKGHTYFGEWFSKYDPMLNDAITGPVEEFRSPDSEIGYNDPANHGLFLKIGVGVLRKLDDTPYKFGGAYPIVDGGQRAIHTGKRSITFTQTLHTTFGYAYRYEKTVELDRHGAILSLHHKLKNLGTKPLQTDVYDHDFFMLDQKPTGPGMVVHLGFPPTPDKPFPPTATITGNDILFNSTIGRGTSPQGYLTGYTGKPGEYRMAVEDTTTHVGVEQTSTSPISKFYFWSTPRTICPEAYIHIDVAPGQTQSWTIQYRFKAE